MRAFLAASPDDSLRERVTVLQQQLKAEAARSNTSRISWTRPETIHLTFRFFLELDERLVASMHDAIETATRESSAIRIPLSRLGAFPRTLAPRVIWIGPPAEWEGSADRRRLVRLAAAIDQACAGLGLAPDDKSWRPHLTLARIKEGERGVGHALSDAGLFEKLALSDTLNVDSISLIRSDAGPAGHVHTLLWTVAFL